MRSINADIADLMAEQPDAPEGFVYVDGEQMAERTAAVNGLLQSNGGKTIPAIIRSNAAGQQPGAQTRTIQPSKTLFRSGEPMSCKYDVTGIDAEKCLRAAITGDYSKLTDAEKRSVTLQHRRRYACPGGIRSSLTIYVRWIGLRPFSRRS